MGPPQQTLIAASDTNTPLLTLSASATGIECTVLFCRLRMSISDLREIDKDPCLRKPVI